MKHTTPRPPLAERMMRELNRLEYLQAEDPYPDQERPHWTRAARIVRIRQLRELLALPNPDDIDD